LLLCYKLVTFSCLLPPSTLLVLNGRRLKIKCLLILVLPHLRCEQYRRTPPRILLTLNLECAYLPISTLLLRMAVVCRMLTSSICQLCQPCTLQSSSHLRDHRFVELNKRPLHQPLHVLSQLFPLRIMQQLTTRLFLRDRKGTKSKEPRFIGCAGKGSCPGFR